MKKLLRILAYIAASVVVLVGICALSIFFVSSSKIAAKVQAPYDTIEIPRDSASIARGRHLARSIAKCAECHGENLGGKPVVDNGPMGRIVSRNLTSGTGGIGGNRTDGDIVRAMRHGVAPDGRRLAIMPSAEYVHLSAEDVGAIVAYVRSMPPVNQTPPTMSYGPILRMLVAFNVMPVFEADRLDHTLKPAAAVSVGPTVEYGRYIARVGGCMGCHGETLSGGKITSGDPSWPPAANLTPTGLKAYTEEMFYSVLRTGKRPDGSEVKAPMPIKWTAEMTPDELKAVWEYLKTVPPKDYGGR